MAMQRAAEEKGTSMSIGEVISAAREAQGMTQSDLAGEVLVTRQAVSRWETGVTTPGVDMWLFVFEGVVGGAYRLVEVVAARWSLRRPAWMRLRMV